MTATLIDGKAIALQVRTELRDEIDSWVAGGGRRPGLATVLVGEDPASAVYVGGKQKACAEVGIEGFAHHLPADTPEDDVVALLQELNADDRVSGILLQLPTPDHIDGSHLTTLIDAGKDVDGLTPVSAGLLAKGLPGLRPCTPSGCIELLKRHDVTLEGAEAVVVGRSDLVGKPVAALLLAENATVTICHSRTRDLEEVCRRADILVAAVGRPEMVKGSWIKPGATVLDVGINRTDSGLVGDVEFASAVEVAGLITPVPGGVGPMTIAMLLRNTLQAARAADAAAVGGADALRDPRNRGRGYRRLRLGWGRGGLRRGRRPVKADKLVRRTYGFVAETRAPAATIPANLSPDCRFAGSVSRSAASLFESRRSTRWRRTQAPETTPCPGRPARARPPRDPR